MAQPNPTLRDPNPWDSPARILVTLRDLPNPVMELSSPPLQADSLPAELPRKPGGIREGGTN